MGVTIKLTILRGPGKSTALLSTFRNGLSAFRPNVTLACYQQAGRGQKVESPLTLAESRTVGLPWPDIEYLKKLLK